MDNVVTSASKTARSVRKVAAASFLGTTVEYYDFFIYGAAAALVFPRIFFPGFEPASSLLLSLATFGVGFLARPLGGVIFGHFGDRIGRKKMLVLSLVGMGVATVLTGLLPGYVDVGIAAPLLLTFFRLVQGFALGGEWGGATLMVVEHAPANRKGFYGAFAQMGAPAGTTLGTMALFLVSLLPEEQFLSWGWRLPFVASILLIFVGLAVRLSISESPEFQAVQASQGAQRMPVLEAFRKHWREILLVAGSYLSQGVFAYICSVYLISYATTVVGIGRPFALAGIALAGIVAVVLYPLFGHLADRWGRKNTYLIGVLAMGLSVAPAFALVNTGNQALFIFAEVIVFGIAMAPAGGVTGSLFTMVFDADVRYSGASVGYTISQILGGAFAPTIAAALYATSGSSNSLVYYLLAVSTVSLVSVLLLRDRRRTPQAIPAALPVKAP